MKKILLSLAVLAFGASAMQAEEYTIFSSELSETLEWTGDENGFTTTVTVDGKTFTITTAKANSTTNLIKPGDQIRVYKSSDFTISSDDFEFSSVVLTSTGAQYGNTQTVPEGWNQVYDSNADKLYITSETPAKTMTMSATSNQYRVVNIVVSSEIIEAPSTGDDEIAKANSVRETLELAGKTKFVVNYELTVGFVNYNNVFACDAAGDFIQLYGKNTLEVGDVIPAGWEGTYELYNSVTPEITNFTLPEVTKGTFVAKEVAAEDVTVDLVNSVVCIKNVVLDEMTPDGKANFAGWVGETELSFRNNYSLPSVAPGTYDITVVVTIYQNAPSLYVVSYAEAGGAGISDIQADDAAPVYYNLRGVKVANPENGIYLVRRGTKVTKEVIRK